MSTKHTTWYFFYQTKPEDVWYLGLADDRDSLVRDMKPCFTTILDVDNNFESDIAPEDQYKTSYRGPFYIDLDSEDPQEVIDQFKKLLDNLENEYSVDLYQLHLFATGGRGFHLLMPQQMFMKTLPARGTPMLPMIYKEMANDLFVDTLDLAIYSTKRGRMFREPNVQRTNGAYKVPITVEEAKAMTVGLYKELCSAPRGTIERKKPEYHRDLGLMYSKFDDKVGSAIKKLGSRKSDAKMLEKFKDKLPTVLTTVMAGEKLAENAGFQKIATQLSITAHALGQTEEEFLASCEGLIANHVGDGHRYNTPLKRKVELQRMYRYMSNNPSYTFSVGGLKSVMEKGTDVSELEIGYEAAADGEEEEGDGSVPFAISQGVRITRMGIFKKTEEGTVRASALGLDNPKQLLDLETHEIHGYEVDVYVDGVKKEKPKVIHMDAFSSRTQFLKFTMSAASCNITLMDGQIGAIADIMRLKTESNRQQVYTVRREGIDVVQLPGGEVDVIWADQFGVVSSRDINYRLTGSMTDEPRFRTNLRQAPELEDTPEAQEFFDRLFQVNTIENIGRFFGFYLACFIAQPIRCLFSQYPLLQVFGPAGSGKSQTARLFACLHYYKQEPLVNSALDSTKFVYEEMASCGGSMPFILDEFKPREMRRDIQEKAKGILRGNYNGDSIGKGAVTSTTGASQMIVTRVANKSPIIVIGEAMITQSAIMERSILLSINKSDKEGHRDNYTYCRDNRDVLSALGRLCIDRARGIQLEGLRKQVNAFADQVRASVGDRADDNERPIFNIAVLLTGLEFGRRVMRHVFGERYEPQFAAMMESVSKPSDTLIPKVMSEAAKVLTDMAYLSKYADDPRLQLKSGEDYAVAGDAVFLKLKNCWIKYLMFKKITAAEQLYDTYEAFYSAMSTYHGTVDTQCIGNGLKDSPATAVFQFELAKLIRDGVEEFQ